MSARLGRSAFGLLCLGLVVGFTWLSTLPVAASGGALPMPARATLTPSRTPTSLPTAVQPGVGYIHLVANQAPSTAFAVVQWQDGLGGWNLVTGWQTNLPESQHTWAVLPEHFGQGPFRWVVYNRPGGRVVATSAGFSLPSQAEQVVYTLVTVR